MRSTCTATATTRRTGGSCRPASAAVSDAAGSAGRAVAVAPVAYDPALHRRLAQRPAVTSRAPAPAAGAHGQLAARQRAVLAQDALERLDFARGVDVLGRARGDLLRGRPHRLRLVWPAPPSRRVRRLGRAPAREAAGRAGAALGPRAVAVAGPAVAFLVLGVLRGQRL